MEENHVNLEKIQYKAFKFKITTTVLVFEVRKPYQRNNKRCAHHSLIRIVIEKQNFAENVITLPQHKEIFLACYSPPPPLPLFNN